jgi:hypothetical protein
VELVILVLLLMVLAKLPKRQPSTADRGLWLPAMRMGAAVLVAVFVGILAMQLF